MQVKVEMTYKTTWLGLYLQILAFFWLCLGMIYMLQGSEIECSISFLPFLNVLCRSPA